MKEAKWTSLYFARVARFPGNGNLKFILRTRTGWLLFHRKLPSRKRVRKGEETTKLKNTKCIRSPRFTHVCALFHPASRLLEYKITERCSVVAQLLS